MDADNRKDEPIIIALLEVHFENLQAVFLDRCHLAPLRKFPQARTGRAAFREMAKQTAPDRNAQEDSGRTPSERHCPG